MNKSRLIGQTPCIACNGTGSMYRVDPFTNQVYQFLCPFCDGFGVIAVWEKKTTEEVLGEMLIAVEVDE